MPIHDTRVGGQGARMDWGLQRKGIAAIGSWIMDHVRLVDIWPEQETLSYIHGEIYSGGGLAHNAVIDLAKFDIGIPIDAMGCIGDDEDGARLMAECDRHNVERGKMVITDEAPTSYTEVITVQSTGKRTFFHSKGANNLLNYDNIPFEKIESGLVHFGYLMLTDGIDAPDPDFGTVAAKTLHHLQSLGIRTSVDTVSETSERFLRIIPPALKYTDFVILNELEAGRTTGHTILRDDKIDPEALRASARALLDMGKSRLAVIHMHLGAYAITRDGKEQFQPAFALPEGYIQGGAGAGDAFCAGVLAGIHEGWELDECLRFGVAAGAMCLRDATCTGGMDSAETIWKLYDEFPLRDLTI